MAKYVLTIEYDPESDEIDSISEELIKEEPCISVGDLDISDYWDEDSLKLMTKMYDVGIC